MALRLPTGSVHQDHDPHRTNVLPKKYVVPMSVFLYGPVEFYKGTVQDSDNHPFKFGFKIGRKNRYRIRFGWFRTVGSPRWRIHCKKTVLVLLTILGSIIGKTTLLGDKPRDKFPAGPIRLSVGIVFRLVSTDNSLADDPISFLSRKMENINKYCSSQYWTG